VMFHIGVQAKLVVCLTVGIWRSLCRTVFVTYQGALAIMRRQMAWNACMVLVFDGLAVPQRAIP